MTGISIAQRRGKTRGRIHKKGEKNGIFVLTSEKFVVKYVYKTGDEIITNDYAFQISDAYVLDKMLKDDEPYNFPATIKIYTFELNITKANKELVIEDATFIPNDNSDTFSALDGTYSSFRKDTNSLIGKKLKEGDKGVLFFEIYSPNDENITYDGKIIIKLANEDKPIEVKTELR